MKTPDPRPVPGRGWYVFAGALAFASTAAIVAIVAWQVFAPNERQKFVVPGRYTMELAGSASYLIWSDYRTVFEGRWYADTDELPAGARLSVFEKASGRKLATHPNTHVNVSDGDAKRLSLAQFTTEQAGSYEIVVEGDFPPRVLSVGRAYLYGALWRTVGIIALALFGFAAAMAVFAWAYFKREQGKEAAVRGPAAAMPPIAGAQPPHDEAALKQITALVYGLQIAGYFVGVTFIVGVIINYVKRKDVEGTWLASHFRWQIRTFWFGVLWCAIGLALLVVLVGVLILMGTAIWVLYRAIKGWIALSEGRPLEA